MLHQKKNDRSNYTCEGTQTDLEASLKRITQIFCNFVNTNASHCPHSQSSNKRIGILWILQRWYGISNITAIKFKKVGNCCKELISRFPRSSQSNPSRIKRNWSIYQLQPWKEKLRTWNHQFLICFIQCYSWHSWLLMTRLSVQNIYSIEQPLTKFCQMNHYLNQIVKAPMLSIPSCLRPYLPLVKPR